MEQIYKNIHKYVPRLGKGGAAVPWRSDKGYTVLETTNGRDGEYGVILGRFLN
jgi:hypothetical protein